MGTEVHVSAWTADEAAAVAAFEKVFAEFDRLDALMSVWKEGSDVLRINEAAGKTAVAVSPEVREVLRASQEVSEWTGGKFDVTFARAFRPLEVRSRHRRPGPGSLTKSLRGFRSLTTGRSRSTTGWHCGDWLAPG